MKQNRPYALTYFWRYVWIPRLKIISTFFLFQNNALTFTLNFIYKVIADCLWFYVFFYLIKIILGIMGNLPTLEFMKKIRNMHFNVSCSGFQFSHYSLQLYLWSCCLMVNILEICKVFCTYLEFTWTLLS